MCLPRTRPVGTAMRRSPELRPTGWDALVVLAVILLAAGCALAVWGRGGGTEALTAVVSVDGAEADRIPLDGRAGERVYSGNGYTLTVEFGPEGVRVREADCPIQDCVHTGTITRSGQSIVCLPGRIIVQLEGGTADNEAPDIVIG